MLIYILFYIIYIKAIFKQISELKKNIYGFAEWKATNEIFVLLWRMQTLV